MDMLKNIKGHNLLKLTKLLYKQFFKIDVQPF